MLQRWGSPVTANSEQVLDADSVDSAIQQMVGSGGQRVITIVTDGVQLGNLQGSISSSGIGQQFIVTMQDGQQVLTVPAGHFAEETIIEEEEEEEEDEDEKPPAKKQRFEHVVNNGEENQFLIDDRERELLQQQLHEANCKAQEYRQQLHRKEQEAEHFRLKLEAMGQHQINGGELTVLEEIGEDSVIVTSELMDGTVTTEVMTMEQSSDIPLDTVT